jgi:ubiquitin-protein ligase
MLYNFTKKEKNKNYYEKLIYYVNLKKINYIINENNIILNIDNKTYVKINFYENVELYTNNKYLFTFVDLFNEKMNELSHLTYEDIVYQLIIHIKINKKIKKLELKKTLDNFRCAYISICKNNNLNNNLKLISINKSLVKISKNYKYDILSFTNYPIIDILQKHNINNKQINVYIKYNFFTEMPLKLIINCKENIKNELCKKIENISIFTDWKMWIYSLEYINDRIFNIIEKYGKIESNELSFLEFMIIRLETIMEINKDNINNELLINEIDSSLMIVDENSNNLSYEDEEIIINIKMQSLFNFLKNINYTILDIEYICRIKKIIYEYLEYNFLNYNDVIYKILNFIISNLKYYNINNEDNITIYYINIFLHNKQILYKIEYYNENDFNNGNYIINMGENHNKSNLENIHIDDNNNFKRKYNKRKISDIIDNDDKIEINNKLEDNYKIEEKKYEDIINKYKIISCNDFINFSYNITNSCPLLLRKIIRKEFEIMDKNIIINHKSGIFVCKNMRELNKMRFMITGPYGTPYENGLFIFDIYITNEYPEKPPHVKFLNNGGKRLNPNLYVDGKVCLSLLGTWAGDKNEEWNSNISNIFQILISIQSLILVDDPYYNEPGYEKDGHLETINESIEYNNTVKLHTINHCMSDLLNDLESENPNYKEFHNIIYEHFKYKKLEILEKMNELDSIYDDAIYKFKKLINIL